MGLLEELWDIEAIKKLKYRYGYLVDDSRWDEVMELWTDDAIAEPGPYGKHSGKEAIGKFYREFMPRLVPFVAHMLHNPLIEVHGDFATGQWYFQAAATHGPSGRAVWFMGRYIHEFQRVGDQWKFKKFKAVVQYITPYDEGWVKTPMLSA